MELRAVRSPFVPELVQVYDPAGNVVARANLNYGLVWRVKGPPVRVKLREVRVALAEYLPDVTWEEF